jgi:hypothetical protein
MYDAGKIITGLIIFLILITFPIWFNAAGGNINKVPDLKIVTGAKQCVAPKDFIRTNHMQLLNDWRDKVVREKQRYFLAPDGNYYEMSLSNTCMQCHPNKSEFCDQCHNYLNVFPYCWDCHVQPEEQ